MTANDVINTALRRINSIQTGENPTNAESQAALLSLNDMLDSWQTERLMIYSIQRQVFSLNAGQQTYKVGPGGDFNIPRPSRIERYGIINVQNPGQPMEIPLEPLTEAQWQRIPVKNVSSTVPLQVWDDNGFPWRNLNYWTIPSVSVGATLYTWALLGSFVDLATDYVFPPGYADALKWNLAYRLASEFGGFMPPQVPAMALESRARIKAMNTPLIDLRCDSGIVATGDQKYNWLTDTPIGSR
jgi:hypothetical protein